METSDPESHDHLNNQDNEENVFKTELSDDENVEKDTSRNSENESSKDETEEKQENESLKDDNNLTPNESNKKESSENESSDSSSEDSSDSEDDHSKTQDDLQDKDQCDKENDKSKDNLKEDEPEEANISNDFKNNNTEDVDSDTAEDPYSDNERVADKDLSDEKQLPNEEKNEEPEVREEEKDTKKEDSLSEDISENEEENLHEEPDKDSDIGNQEENEINPTLDNIKKVEDADESPINNEELPAENDLTESDNAEKYNKDLNVTQDKPHEEDPVHNNKDPSPENSDSSSDEEDMTGPVVIKQKPDKDQDDKSGDLAQSLKKALEEREKQKQQEEPIDIHDNSLDLPSEIDDSSIRARRAEDFEPQPPVLPPKLKPKSQNLPPKRTPTPPNIFQVKDKNATLGRGMWSDDEENEAPPTSYQPIRNGHPPPDRVIDFSQGNSVPQRSNSRPSRSRNNNNHGPPSRIIDVNGPYDGPNEAYKRQAVVSLPPTQFDDDIDPYDSVPEESLGDLSKLIQEANNLDINAPEDRKSEDPVDVLYPSFQRTLPAQKNLSNAYPDAFAKLATLKPESPKKPETNDLEEDIPFGAIPRGPLQEFPARNSRTIPRKRGKSYNEEDPLKDPLDGDDEISIAESDFRINSSPRDEPKSMDASEYLCEVYPSDYTDFETASEADNPHTLSMNPLHHDITPYDTVAAETDWDMPKPMEDEDMNPIVSEDYQICTDLGNNHNTFPRRMKNGKTKPKERVSLNMVAVALTDPLAGPSSRYTSLPLNDTNNLRRPKSNPDLNAEPQSLVVKNPHIVVTRGPTHPDGYEADYSLYQPTSLPTFVENRPKKKKKTIKTDDPRQIHLSLSPTSNSDTDNTVVAAPNNLQINVLPSNDPNIINLNIRTTDVEPTAPPLVNDDMVVYNEEPIASPLQLQPIVPMTAISHRENDPSVLVEHSAPQHRVVDIAPVLINTQPVIPDPEPMMSMNQPMVPVSQPYQQPMYIHQAITPEPIIVPQQEIQVMSAPPPIEPIVVMTQPRPMERQQSLPQPLNNVVVDIEDPWQERQKSLSGHGLRHGGDSGIDLTNYESKKNGSLSSSDDSTHYDMKRQSSKRKLADADQLRDGLSEEYIDWYKKKYLKPSHLYLCLKHFIFILNLIFILFGLALVGLGTWGFIDMYLNGLSDPSEILLDPIFPVFVIGIFITLAASQGAVGFLRDNICMIRFFGWCLVFFCIIFVAGGICFWVMMGTITKFTTDHFTNWVTNYNETSRKASAFTINQMQLQFGCCGISNSNDWLKNSDYKCSGAVESCSLPPSCCMDQEQCNMLSGAYQYDGCLDAMTVWVKDKTPILIGVWLGIILLFNLEFVCVYFMIREVRYLRLVNKKIFSLCKHDYRSDQSVTESSSEDSEYEERRRRRRRRKRKRQNKKKRNYFVNKGYN